MAVIRPFRAWRFAPAAGSIEELVCPPYDIISDEQRRAYLARNPHNIIRLELPREGADPYAEAGETFRRFCADGVLQRDEAPALYVYDIAFDADGGRRHVTGLIGAVELAEWSEGVVLPHEETLSKAKADRFQLMQATNCNFSDIYSLYQGHLQDILDAAMSGAPLTEVTDEAGDTHRLWAIVSPETIAEVARRLADTKLYIADGHHRYETALNYRRDRREKGLPEGGAGTVMMMIVDMAHEGLWVWPTHRLVRGLPAFDEAALLAACEQHFTVERLPLVQAKAALAAAYDAGKKAFVYYGGAEAALLTLRDPAIMDKALPALSAASRQLDVNVLHTLVLEQLLGIDKENMAKQINLTYTRDADEAEAGVRDGGCQCCFLLNPTRVSEIRDVAAADEKMPQKSTYFYPKLITGLTVHELDE